MRASGVLALAFSLTLAPCAWTQEPAGATSSAPLAAKVTLLAADGGRVDWSPDGSRIAFDRLGADGFYDVWVMNADGTGAVNLTDRKSGLPSKHCGNPAWHPSGKYLVFQAEKEEAPRFLDRQAEPGSGVLNDLWVIAADGSGARRVWRLDEAQLRRPDRAKDEFPRQMERMARRRQEQAERRAWRDDPSTPRPVTERDLRTAEPPPDPEMRSFRREKGRRAWKEVPGTLHPHFSPDGRKLVWAERTGSENRPFGSWLLRVGTFSIGADGPVLSDVKSYAPFGAIFYESHSFSPDGSKVLFTANPDRRLDVCILDLATGRAEDLMRGFADWNEHAHFSPDGRAILFMSSRGYPFRARPLELKTEFWLMAADGSGKRRLTGFNDPASPDYRGGATAVAADSSWAPDGRRFAGLVITASPEGPERGKGFIALVEPARSP